MIKIYGADWCGDTKKSIACLKNLGVDFQYVNVEEDRTASEWVKNQNGGKEKKPTVSIGKTILSVPTDSELESALKKEGLIA